jgi:hypothetical protein
MVTIRSSSSEVSSPALFCPSVSGSNIFHQCFALPFVEIDISLLADKVGVTTSDTLYFGQCVHDLLLSLDIGIEKT